MLSKELFGHIEGGLYECHSKTSKNAIYGIENATNGGFGIGFSIFP
jgi:hypothetical protein